MNSLQYPKGGDLLISIALIHNKSEILTTDHDKDKRVKGWVLIQTETTFFTLKSVKSEYEVLLFLK